MYVGLSKDNENGGGKLMADTDFYESGEGESEGALSRSIDDIESDQRENPLGANPSRESLRVTRFPVSMEELQQMKSVVAAAEPSALEAEQALAQEEPETEEELKQEGVPEVDISAPALAPAILSSFQSIQQTAFTPPDCTIGVGPEDVVVAANTVMAIYSKTGVPKNTWQLKSLFSPVIPTNAKIFDPKVAYDHYNHRWVITLDSTRGSPKGSWILIAVSKSANPSGPYWIWALNARQDGSTTRDNWADYSQLGFDWRGIYITNNMFKFGGGFSYVKIRILNKSQLYSGSAVQWYDYWNLRNPGGDIAFTLQPAVHYTGVGGNPPAYFVNARWPSGTSLTKWTLSNPLGFWEGTGTGSLTRVAVNCMKYDLPPDGEQKGSNTRIETNDSRLLNAVYQFVGGTRRLWTCHASRHTWQGSSSSVSVLQWYEIDALSNTVIQQGRFGARNWYYFFPAIQTNIVRDAFLIFGRVAKSAFVQLRQTGRRSNAPPNILQNSALIKAGESAYTRGRWGDYEGICRDPANARRIWMNGEYAETGDTWGTWTCEVQ